MSKRKLGRGRGREGRQKKAYDSLGKKTYDKINWEKSVLSIVKFLLFSL